MLNSFQQSLNNQKEDMNARNEHFPKINTEFSSELVETEAPALPQGIIEATERCLDALTRLSNEIDGLDVKTSNFRRAGLPDDFVVKFADRPSESTVSTLLRTIEHRIQVATDRVISLSQEMDV